MKINKIFLIVIFLYCAVSFAQKLKIEDYKKALWMTTRMYGGQRSGHGPNWLIMDHKSGKDFILDSDNGYDLSGGWHDCGDHVKFGQTQFYSAYMLLKAYSEFPRGFGDYYFHDYRGYRESGDFSWEGAKGIPNGIPDILDEVKYATDYFIKCAKDNSTFYYQVGEGALDHKNWVTSVAMAALSYDQGGQPRKVFKNPNDASMPSFCAATLALMSRMYRKFDKAYADRCLQHAKYAYEYAKQHPGTVGSADGNFYPANRNWYDDFICAAIELFYATADEKYKQEALDKQNNIGDHHWSLCYNNNDDLAAYNLAKIGSIQGKRTLSSIVKRYKENVTADGVGKTGNEWGILRYSASQAYAAALLAVLNQDTSVDPFIYKTVDYILGVNSASQSFVVGFGLKSPKHPHHRNVYINDDNVPDSKKNTLQIPLRNAQHGYMVGGSLDPASYVDDINDYRYSEGGIDYNCGLVGALGFILSVIAPYDTSSVSVKHKFEIVGSKANGLNKFDFSSIEIKSYTTAFMIDYNKDVIDLRGRNIRRIVNAKKSRLQWIAPGIFLAK